MHLFRCPDCGQEHDEPADGTFVLAVVCLDCAFSAERQWMHTSNAEAGLPAAA